MWGAPAARIASALFVFGFIFSQAVLAVEFTKVPKACEKILRSINRTSGDALKAKVDWTPVVESFAEAGYPERIAREKLEELSWDEGFVLDSVRRVVDDSQWDWGDKLTRKDVVALARSPDFGFYHRDFILKNLPYWHSFKGFDATIFVNEWLKAKAKENHGLDEEQVNYLRRYAKLWLKGELGFKNAQMFFEQLQEVQDVSWMSKQLPSARRRKIERLIRREIQRDFFQKKDADIASEDLVYSSMLPWANLPADVRDYMAENYIDLEAYKPIKLDSIHLISNGYHGAGNCQMMTNGHVNSLGLHNPECDEGAIGFEEYKNAILIRVRGKLIGSLKLVGDNSMIALRNVFDSNGRLVLAMGGVYHIDKTTFDRMDIQRSRSRNWKSVRLNSLGVHPHSFLLNEAAWTSTNATQLLQIAAEAMTRDELLAIIRQLPDHNVFESEESEEMRKKAWTGLLKALDRVRNELE